jgi:transcriptional regulator with PAS, ATPase and Fis domain
MRMRRGGWVHRLLRALSTRARASEKDRVMLEEALGHAYEGLIITDPAGKILKANQAYADFLGLRLDQMIGRHVTEVVENTRMHVVGRTGVAEIAHVQRIGGHEMICSRIPIVEDGRLVAVVGKIIFKDVDDLFAMTGRFRSLKKELDFYKTELDRQLGARYSFDSIAGRSEQLERVKELARKVARSDTTVLVVGESGTGKELFAHAIHVESGRTLRPFIKVNCAAIPAELFESELFGYREGAFTGARAKGKKGKFELAHQGTLFLDEISELPLTMQAKLLRVLQEREVEPLGAEQPLAVDVRIVAATNRRLEPLLEQGTFRHDLYYRLNVVRLDIPPLRERRDDLPLLVERILRQLERETGVPVEGVDEAAEAALRGHPWPGNVRELRNVLEQALYVKTGPIITRDDLPPALLAGEPGEADRGARRSLRALLRQTEVDLIARALREAGGDRAVAAERLGISKSSIYAKIEQHGLATGRSRLAESDSSILDSVRGR